MVVLNQKAAGVDGLRHEVLARSLQLASRHGLEALSVGLLASELKMSRSGLFYYVKSLESFQIELIDYSAELYKRSVIDPVLLIASPVEKLRAFLSRWPGWTDASEPKLPGGCPLVSFLFELDGKKGVLHDRILHQIDRLDQFLSFLFRSCVESKDFDPGRSAAEFVHDCWGYYLPLLWSKQRGIKGPSSRELEARIAELVHKYRRKRSAS